MEENRFENILNFLCSGIMSKKERNNVKDELYDHLMTKYEIFLAIGMDEEKATDEAIKSLGNKEQIRFKLSQVHSYYPALSVKKAMTLLIVGYVLMTFHINFFDGMQQITDFIGSVIFLVGLFCFRTANRKLELAFGLRSVLMLSSVINYAFNPLFANYSVYNIVFGVFEILLNATSLILIFNGLKKLAEPFCVDSKKPLRFGLCSFLFCVPTVAGGLLALIITRGEQTTVNFTLDDIGILIIPFFVIIIVSFIMPLQLFTRLNKLLYASDHEYKVADSTFQKFAVGFAVIFVSISLTIIGDYAYTNRKSETKPYTVEDFALTETEYKTICNGLRSYSIPNEVINKLPYSELVKYKGIVNYEDLSKRYELLIDNRIYSPEGYTEYSGYEIIDYLSVSDKYYPVMISDENGVRIRILSHFKYEKMKESKTEPKYYTDGICMYFNNRSNSIMPSYIGNINYNNDDSKYNEDFLLILSEENGTLMKNEPLMIYDKETVNVFPYSGIAGFEYEAKLGMDIFFATSYFIPNEETCYTSKDVKLIHRSSPFVIGSRTIKDLLEFGETIHFNNIYGYKELHISNSLWWKNYERIEEIENQKSEGFVEENTDVNSDNEYYYEEITEISDSRITL